MARIHEHPYQLRPIQEAVQNPRSAFLPRISGTSTSLSINYHKQPTPESRSFPPFPFHPRQTRRPNRPTSATTALAITSEQVPPSPLSHQSRSSHRPSVPSYPLPQAPRPLFTAPISSTPQQVLARVLVETYIPPQNPPLQTKTQHSRPFRSSQPQAFS